MRNLRSLVYGRQHAVTIFASAAMLYGCPEDPEAKCGNDGECLPGFICEQNVCIEGNRGEITVGICPEGGTVAAAGVSLEVPANAVAECVRITLRQASGGLNAAEVHELSSFWVFTPEGTTFSVPATVRIETDTSDLRPGEMITVWQSQSPTGPWASLDGTATASVAVGKTTTLGLFVGGVPRRPDPDGGIIPDTGLHPDATHDGGILDADGGFPLVDTGPRNPDAVVMMPDLGEVPDMGPRVNDGGNDGHEDADTPPPVPDTGMMVMIPDTGNGMVPDMGMGGIPDSGNGMMQDTGMGGMNDTGMGMGDGGMGLPDSGFGGMGDGGMGAPDSGMGSMGGDGGGIPDLGFGGGGDGGGGLPDSGMGALGDSGLGGFGDTGMGMDDMGIGGPPDSGMNFEDGGGVGDTGMSGFDEAGIGFPDSGGGGGPPGGDM